MKGNDNAEDLSRQAFHLVERGSYDEAINLLNQAIEIDPLFGHAYNELAFIHGKIMGNLDVAEKYARQAIECEPNNPKFHGTINGIQMARAKQLTTKREKTESMMKRLAEIEVNIERDPEYPPTYLMKAVTLAFMGEPKEKWEAELERARQLYIKSGISATGKKLAPHEIESIVDRNRNECFEASILWDSARE